MLSFQTLSDSWGWRSVNSDVSSVGQVVDEGRDAVTDPPNVGPHRVQDLSLTATTKYRVFLSHNCSLLVFASNMTINRSTTFQTQCKTAHFTSCSNHFYCQLVLVLYIVLVAVTVSRTWIIFIIISYYLAKVIGWGRIACLLHFFLHNFFLNSA